MTGFDVIPGPLNDQCGEQLEPALGATAALAPSQAECAAETFRLAVIGRLKQAELSALEASNNKRARATERKAHAHCFYAFRVAILMVEGVQNPFSSVDHVSGHEASQ